MEYIKNFLVGVVVVGIIAGVTMDLFKIIELYPEHVIITLALFLAAFITYSLGVVFREIFRLSKQNKS